MVSEGRSELAYQFSQLTIGIRRDVSGLVELRYRDPLVSTPQQVFCVIQTCTREPSRNLLDVSLFQNLRDNGCLYVEKLRRETDLGWWNRRNDAQELP